MKNTTPFNMTVKQLFDGVKRIVTGTYRVAKDCREKALSVGVSLVESIMGAAPPTFAYATVGPNPGSVDAMVSAVNRPPSLVQRIKEKLRL